MIDLVFSIFVIVAQTCWFHLFLCQAVVFRCLIRSQRENIIHLFRLIVLLSLIVRVFLVSSLEFLQQNGSHREFTIVGGSLFNALDCCSACFVGSPSFSCLLEVKQLLPVSSLFLLLFSVLRLIRHEWKHRLKTFLEKHGKIAPAELTKEDRDRYQTMFDLLDVKHYGTLEASEILTAIQAFGIKMNLKEVIEKMNCYDANHRGALVCVFFLHRTENFLFFFKLLACCCCF